MTQESWLTDKKAKADAAVVAAQAARAALDTPIPTPVVPPPPPPPSSGTQTITYQPTNEDFPNPQRGMQDSYETYWTNDLLGQWNRLNAGETTARRVVGLPVTESSLPTSIPTGLATDFNWARGKGITIDLRFVYAMDTGWPEPSFAAMLRHQAQLLPVLNQYAHLINLMEPGMIGPWGEGHSVTAAGFGEADKGGAYPKRLQLWRGWGPNLRVPWRYAWQAMWAESQMTAAERVRMAFNNDQFLAGGLGEPDHGGTFKGRWDDTTEIDAQKAWLAKFTETHQFRAESDWPKPPATIGAYAQAHIDDDGPARYHADTWRDIRGLLPSTFTPEKQAELRRRLGYRLVLKSAELPTSLRRGQQATISLVINNEGYAPPRRQRPAYIAINGVLAPLGVDAAAWAPGQRTVNATFTVPTTASSGPLALALPDPHPALSAPAYAIRLATLGTWDAATGHNKLNANVTVLA